MSRISDVFDMRYVNQGVDLLHPPPPCRQRYLNRQIPLDIPANVMEAQNIDFEMNGSRFQTAFGFPNTAPRLGDRAPPPSQMPMSTFSPSEYFRLPRLPSVDFDGWLPWILMMVMFLFILDKLLLIFLLRK